MTTFPTARILFAGGGTGGHLFPALAIAERVMKMAEGRLDVSVRFVGTKRGLEYRMRDTLGFPLELINVRGLQRSLSLKNLLVPIVLVAALARSASLLRRFNPDLIVGTGGYVCWPVLKLAGIKKIPTFLQEQNSFPGLTTRQNAARAKRIYLGYAGAKEYLSTSGEIIVSGNPVRSNISGGSREEGMKVFNLSPSKKTILILGGSQGAASINQAVLRSLNTPGLGDDTQILWQTGKRDYKEVAAEAGRRVSACSLFPFIDRMELAYAVADLAVVRAGALTLAELSACGVPALLIPFPHAAGNHQHKNALETAAMGMAEVIEDKSLPAIDLLGKAVELMSSPKFEQMKKAVEKAGRTTPAAERIAGDIIDYIESSKIKDANIERSS